MTPEHSRNSSLGFIYTVIAILIVSVAFVAQAQLTASGQQSAQQAALSAWQDSPRSRVLQHLQHLALPGVNSAERAPAIRRQSDTLAVGGMASDMPLFISAATYNSGGGGAFSVAVADVNNDDKPDMIVANCGATLNDCGRGVVGVLLGNGDGTFNPPVTYVAGGGVAMSVAAEDMNNDGKLDLVVANGCDSHGCDHAVVGVLLGNGDGTFQPALTYSSGGYYADSVAVGDVNNDGKPDLLVANLCLDTTCADGGVGVLLGNGDGTFQPALTYSSGGSYANSIAVGDVNNDGKPDLLVPNQCASRTNCNGSVVDVLLGNGDGTFQSAVTYGSGGAGAESIAVADVNDDGKPDLLVANQQGLTPCFGCAVGVLLGNGDGTFQPAVSYSSGGYSLAVRDVNGDDKPDLVVSSSAVGVLLGNGDGTFQSAVTYGSGGGTAYSVAVADINGDGRPDVLATNYCTGPDPCLGSVDVLLNNAGPHISTTTALVSSANPSDVRQIVTYTAVVTGKSGKPVTGTVAFRDGASDVAIVTLSGNQAAYSTEYKTAGVHAMTAAYSGDLYNSNSISATVTEYIRGTSRTIVNTSGTPSFMGQPVTFTSTVTSPFGTIPNGELITFYDGTTVLGTRTTTGGVATFTTSSLTVKTHTIKATYAGDATFKSSFGMVTQVVNGYTTSTALTSSLNPAIYGQKVTWAAVVKSSTTVAPTGSVVFNGKDMYGHTFVIGRATLDRGGVATLVKSNLNVNTYQVTAVYLGDTMNEGSTSSVLNQVVTETTSRAVLSSSQNPAAQGQVVTFTATITSPTVTPTGPVTFTAGKQVLGTAQIVPWAHKATLAISTLPVGSTVVTVTYLGDSNIARSSASLTQTVQ
jgi:hypothetical protein